MTDYFEGDTSSFTDDFTGTVTGFDYEEGTFGPQIKVTVKYDEPQPKNDGTLAVDKWFWLPVPNGFVVRDGRLIHESGDLDKRMSANSKLQKVMKYAADGGAREYLTRDGTTPYHLAAWIGLRAHWMTVEAGQDYNVKDRDTGEAKSGKTKGFPAPVEYLGGQAELQLTNGAVKGGLNLADLAIPDDILDAWIGLAVNETADKFLQDASPLIPSLPDATRTKVVAALGSGALYETLRTSGV